MFKCHICKLQYWIDLLIVDLELDFELKFIGARKTADKLSSLNIGQTMI